MTGRTGPVLAVTLAAIVVIPTGQAQVAAPTSQTENLTTPAAQRKLVEGLAPVKPVMRVLRALNAPRPAGALRLPPPPYDLSKTPEAKAGEAELATIRKNVVGSGWTEEAAPGKERVIFAGNDGREIELEYDTKELAALGERAMARGINNASAERTQKEPEPVQPWMVVRTAWAGGTDNRVDKSISSTYLTGHRVLRRIGELNGGGCSAALVGRRLLLTAAHCIVRADLSYNVHSFRARRSGTEMPYGTVNTVGYWYASKWVSNNCHTNRRWDPCSPHDWAILLLPDNAFSGSPNGHPGWMGYWVYGQNYIATNAVSHNDGYPLCGFPSSPAGCASKMNRPWGQVAGCTATGFTWPYDNVAAYYRISCDISGGHSGSPNWTDYPGQNGPYVIGIAMWEHCFLCNTAEGATGDTKSHPSGFRGMTHYLADAITAKRVEYP